MNETKYPEQDQYIKVTKGENDLIGGSPGGGVPKGTIGKVTNVQKQNQTFSIIAGNNYSYAVYAYDGWVPASREEIFELLNEKKSDLDSKMQEITAEIDFYTKYESEAHFVAEKIDQLMKADTIEAKVEILNVLKKSHYI